MTEEEWLAANDPTPMLEFVRDKTSDRKLRLFACGVCRQLASFVRIDECLFGIAEAECRADGDRTKAAMKRSRQTLENRSSRLPFSKNTKESYVLFLCIFAMYDNDFRNFMRMFSYEGIIPNDDCYKETAPKVPLIARDIFGNPFRPVTFDPSADINCPRTRSGHLRRACFRPNAHPC